MKILAGLAGASLVLAATAASAGTVDVGNYTGVPVTLTATVTDPDVTGRYIAGSTTISDVKGLEGLADGASFLSFCVDLQHAIDPPVYDQNASLQLMSEWDGYGNFKPQTNAGNYAAYLYNTNVSLASTNAARAGLQLAIWNVLYDNDFIVDGATPGAFAVSGSSTTGARNAANAYLADLQANLTSAASHDAYWIRLYPVGGNPEDSPQDFIGPRVVTTPDGGATLALLGGGLMALGAVRRRFAK